VLYGKVETTTTCGLKKHKPQDNVFLEIRQAQKVDGFVSKMWITFDRSVVTLEPVLL